MEEGSPWSVSSKCRRNRHPLLEMVESWKAEKRNGKINLSCSRSGTSHKKSQDKHHEEIRRKNCWMWGEQDKTVTHLLSECEMLAQREYKKRLGYVASITYWDLCGTYRFQKSKNWFDYRADSVLK